MSEQAITQYAEAAASLRLTTGYLRQLNTWRQWLACLFLPEYRQSMASIVNNALYVIQECSQLVEQGAMTDSDRLALKDALVDYEAAWLAVQWRSVRRVLSTYYSWDKRGLV